jgi:hypothetical protein
MILFVFSADSTVEIRGVRRKLSRVSSGDLVGPFRIIQNIARKELGLFLAGSKLFAGESLRLRPHLVRYAQPLRLSRKCGGWDLRIPVPGANVGPCFFRPFAAEVAVSLQVAIDLPSEALLGGSADQVRRDRRQVQVSRIQVFPRRTAGAFSRGARDPGVFLGSGLQTEYLAVSLPDLVSEILVISLVVRAMRSFQAACGFNGVCIHRLAQIGWGGAAPEAPMRSIHWAITRRKAPSLCQSRPAPSFCRRAKDEGTRS